MFAEAAPELGDIEATCRNSGRRTGFGTRQISSDPINRLTQGTEH
jgi:hypothetical protein